jgi:chitosanase
MLWPFFSAPTVPTYMPHRVSLYQMRVNRRNGLSPAQRLRTEQLISLFENSTIEFQYSYGEVLGDGRGVTAGRAGFTTGTGDAYIVVQQYTNKVPKNPLAKYLPELKRLLTAENRDDISGLRGFIKAWESAAGDPLFRSIQDRIMEQMYYVPSIVHANRQGLRFALSRAVLYDTIIQHGNGDDPDSLSALLTETQRRAGGTPQMGIKERDWLRTFLAVRRAHLSNAHDPTTRKGWAESVTRVDVWSYIADRENYNLTGPIPIRVSYHNTTIP